MKKVKFAILGIAAAAVASLTLGFASPANAADASTTVLAGLTTDGSVYASADDGLWHLIDSATIASLGLGGNTVTWYGELPGTVGDPVAGTATRSTQGATTTTATAVTLAGLIGDGSVYVAGDDGAWHAIDSKTFAARGYDVKAITWYGELPGDVGDPVAAA